MSCWSAPDDREELLESEEHYSIERLRGRMQELQCALEYRDRNELDDNVAQQNKGRSEKPNGTWECRTANPGYTRRR